jgi:hypothetical protein
VLNPTLQIGFYERLKAAESTYLMPALLAHVGTLDIAQIDEELSRFAGQEKLALVAKRGLRGELVYPVPSVIRSNPQLLGYYRLLLGFSQKAFYKGAYSRFAALEEGVMSVTLDSQIEPLCAALVESSWQLVTSIPELSSDIIRSLTLLTIGPQFRGSRNVGLGTDAIEAVFKLVKSIVRNHITEQSATHFVVENNTGRTYRIEFAPDPDIVVKQKYPNGDFRKLVSIEVKGGTDFSNIHNRLGEAEKTHQKARSEGFTQFWTIVNVSNVDRATWKRETPTTTELFYLEQMIVEGSAERSKFSEFLERELGISNRV